MNKKGGGWERGEYQDGDGEKGPEGRFPLLRRAQTAVSRIAKVGTSFELCDRYVSKKNAETRIAERKVKLLRCRQSAKRTCDKSHLVSGVVT
jgi:hypothetical protein